MKRCQLVSPWLQSKMYPHNPEFYEAQSGEIVVNL